jgi:hypothetical protein
MLNSVPEARLWKNLKYSWDFFEKEIKFSKVDTGCSKLCYSDFLFIHSVTHKLKEKLIIINTSTSKDNEHFDTVSKNVHYPEPKKIL